MERSLQLKALSQPGEQRTAAERISRRLFGGIVTSAALFALVACSGLGGGLSEETPRRGSSGTQPGEMPTALHPALRDCAPEGSDDTLTLADTDLGQVTWSTPEGFSEVGGYHEDNPVEDIQDMWVAGADSIPPHTLNVISVNSYTNVAWNDFADDCEAVPLDAVAERLARYRAQIGAEELSEAEMVEIDGYPAISQDIRLREYDYEGYWLFSTTQLLHVYCQWEDDGAEQTIRDGCAELVDSLEVP